MSPRRSPEPVPNFTQPALPDLEDLEPAAAERGRPAPPSGRPPLRLATVTELRPVSMGARALDLVAALRAVGVVLDGHQALTLVHAGTVAPIAWAGDGDTPATRAKAATTTASLAADLARRRAEHHTREVLP